MSALQPLLPLHQPVNRHGAQYDRAGRELRPGGGDLEIDQPDGNGGQQHRPMDRPKDRGLAPANGVPPITAPATAKSAIPPPDCGSPRVKNANATMPDSPAIRPATTKPQLRVALIGIPEKAAASGFDPISRMC